MFYDNGSNVLKSVLIMCNDHIKVMNGFIFVYGQLGVLCIWTKVSFDTFFYFSVLVVPDGYLPFKCRSFVRILCKLTGTYPCEMDSYIFNNTKFFPQFVVFFLTCFFPISCLQVFFGWEISLVEKLKQESRSLLGESECWVAVVLPPVSFMSHFYILSYLSTMGWD